MVDKPAQTTNAEHFRMTIDEIKCDTPAECIRSFIAILDGTDESEAGTKFHPVQISSVRVLESVKLAKVLAAMRVIASGNRP